MAKNERKKRMYAADVEQSDLEYIKAKKAKRARMLKHTSAPNRT